MPSLLTEATSSTHGSTRARFAPLDPRTKLLAILIVNGLVLGTAPLIWTQVGFVLATLLLATTAPWRWVSGYACFFVVSYALYLIPTALFPSAFSTAVSLTGFWVAKFSVAFGLAAYLVFSTSPTELTAGLRRMRVPSMVIIPFAVMLRFLPTVGTELKSIVDAMRLRGVTPTPGKMLLHPIRTAEYVMVPLLASSTRLADDLSASALVRGLGTVSRPTSITKMGFTWFDLLMLALLALMIAAQLSGMAMRSPL